MENDDNQLLLFKQPLPLSNTVSSPKSVAFEKKYLTLTQMMKLVWEKDDSQTVLIIRALLSMHTKRLEGSEFAKSIYLKLIAAEIALKRDLADVTHLLQDVLLLLQRKHT